MRILYLHQYFNTPEMAGGTRSYELARRLVERGHEVHMVAADRGDDRGRRSRQSVEQGIHVHWLRVPYDQGMSYSRRIRAFVEFGLRAARSGASLGGDVVFATSTPLTIALPGIYAARRLGVPMVFEVRDLWPAVPIALGALKNPVLVGAARWLERFAYGNSARVVALAPGMKEAVVERGYPADRVVVIPNGSELGSFEKREEMGAGIRASHSWLGQRPLVSFTGSIGRVNGVDYLVRLAREIGRLDPEVRFALVGKGGEATRVRELATELGVLDRNLFMLGPLPRVETNRWLSAATISIALFTGPRIVWKDATQNKFFDSLAAGCPVANNFNGWQAQVAEEAGAGFILSSDDIPGAARKLLRHLKDHAWLQHARTAARTLAEERFSCDIHAARLEGVLQDAVRHGPERNAIRKS